jgi:hypothetical protein
MRMPGAAKARAPNLSIKDSKVVKWTQSDPKTEDRSSKIRSPLADGTEKAAPRKSAERPSQTKSVFGINTDFLGCTKYPRATLRLTTTKAAAPAEANGPGCPVRVSGREIAVPNASSSRNSYRRPKRRRKPATSPEKHV